MSILFPDTGRTLRAGAQVRLGGEDRIGYCPKERGTYRKMKIGASSSIWRGQGCDGKCGAGKTRRAITRVGGLEGTSRKRCEELSKGMLQKVQSWPRPFISRTFSYSTNLQRSGPGEFPACCGNWYGEHKGRDESCFLRSDAARRRALRNVIMIHQGPESTDERIDAIRRQYIATHSFESRSNVDVSPLQRFQS